MTTIQRSALIALPPEKLFALVDDFPSYPQFLPGCSAATEIERVDNRVVGRLEISRAGMKQQLTTENILTPPNQIEMRLVDGPFERFGGVWRFDALGDLGCKVSLELEFEINSGLANASFAPIFKDTANKLVDAFCDRAMELYG